MIKVIIVDDHALVRAGLRRILSHQDQIEVLGEAESGADALALAKRVEPHICLMDVQMPGGMGGIEATRRLRRLLPDCQVIALTVLRDDPFPAQLLEAGAMGYLTKGCAEAELVTAVRTVASGRLYFDSMLAQARITKMFKGEDGSPASPFKELSSREMQVALMILDGKRTQEISDTLSLSPKTVSTYRQRIHEKLGVETDVDLTRLAYRHGLLNEGGGTNDGAGSL